MKEIDEFVEELFREEIFNFRIGKQGWQELYEKTKVTVSNELEEKYNNLIDTGMDSNKALISVLGGFGAKEGQAKAIAYEKLLEAHMKFQKTYPILKKIGFAGVIIWPIIFVCFLFLFKSKITLLVLWIIYMFILAAYIITIEYMDYRYKQKIAESGKDM